MTEVTYFERLDAPECLRLLRGGGVGRVVWQSDDGLTVLPVNYRIVDDSVIFHTGAASTLARLVEPTSVAFQVDEIDHATAVGWSVLVRGTSGPCEAAEVASFLPRDPAIGVAVRIEEVTGRVISGNPVSRI
jgi:DNA-binding protein